MNDQLSKAQNGVIGLFLLILIAVMGGCPKTTDNVEPDNLNVETVNTETKETLRAVAYGNNLYVAVGDNGTILTGSDIKKWTEQTSGTPNNLNGVEYVNKDKGFLVVGDKGTILKSSDGISWTEQTSGTPNKLNAVESASGQEGLGNTLSIVVVGSKGTILSSNDGDSWVVEDSITEKELRGVTYIPHVGLDDKEELEFRETFVAVGEGGLILKKPKEESWEEWTHSATTGNLNAVMYGGGVLIAVGDNGTILRYYKGSSWETIQSGTTKNLYGVCNIPIKPIIPYINLFFAVGDEGVLLKNTNFLRSWESGDSETKRSLKGAARGKEGMVAVGEQGSVIFVPK